MFSVEKSSFQDPFWLCFLQANDKVLTKNRRGRVDLSGRHMFVFLIMLLLFRDRQAQRVHSEGASSVRAGVGPSLGSLVPSEDLRRQLQGPLGTRRH